MISICTRHVYIVIRVIQHTMSMQYMVLQGAYSMFPWWKCPPDWCHVYYYVVFGFQFLLDWELLKISVLTWFAHFYSFHGNIAFTHSNHLDVTIKLTISQREDTWGLIYKQGLTFIPAWRSNHMPGKVWDEITYPFLNVNGATVEV